MEKITDIEKEATGENKRKIFVFSDAGSDAAVMVEEGSPVSAKVDELEFTPERKTEQKSRLEIAIDEEHEFGMIVDDGSQ